MKTRITSLVVSSAVVFGLVLAASSVESKERSDSIPQDVAASATATMEYLVELGDQALQAGAVEKAQRAYGKAFAIALLDAPDHRAQEVLAYVATKLSTALEHTAAEPTQPEYEFVAAAW